MTDSHCNQRQTAFKDWTRNFQRLPLHTLLYEWSLNNMQFPSDFGTLVAYIGLFLITWYTIIWVVRLIMSIIWPLFVIATAIVVFRILQHYEPEEFTSIVTKSFSIIADTMVTVLTKALDLFIDCFD